MTETIIITPARSRSRSGSSKKGRQHAVNAKKYIRQWGRTARNKRNAWVQHLQNHPHDLNAKAAIKESEKTLRSF